MNLVLALILGCAPHHDARLSGPALIHGHGHGHSSDVEDTLDWDIHPGVVYGDIRVAPPIVIATAPATDYTDYVGVRLSDAHAQGRRERTRQMASLPYAVHESMPGALYAELPEGWTGTFRDARLPLNAQRTLERAVAGDGSVAQALSQAARLSGGDATLFTWVVEVDGAPLTASNMVGEFVVLDGTLVVVDHKSEPYEVQTRVGVALVTREGELLFRCEDDFRTLLTDHVPLRHAGQHVARAVVGEIAPMWLEGFEHDEEHAVAGL